MPNPLAGKDEFIEMEPGRRPATSRIPFAIGRLFHADPGVVALTLAPATAASRPLDPGAPLSSPAIPAVRLPMLETFSRISARELASRGYQTTSLDRRSLSPGPLATALA